jgi:hypothetical protein
VKQLVHVFAKHFNENAIFTEPEGWTPLTQALSHFYSTFLYE